ncbi:hypothetical protein DB345_03530 [Spartobacteria bacterium LR76]|nr:hypothetical protein DB345_03530 [Spartobacteria bacterium LR76]
MRRAFSKNTLKTFATAYGNVRFVSLLRLGIVVSLLVSLLTSSAKAEEPPTTIAVYARHTFRGVSKAVPPEVIDLPEIGFRFTPPMFAYGMDAMPEGLRIAQDVYPAGLRAAVEMAGQAVGVKGLDQHWDLIRPDLGTSRDFETALFIRRGLGGKVPLVGVPSRDTEVRDFVTSFSLSALQPETIEEFRRKITPEESRALRESTAGFLQAFQQAALGTSQPVTIPPVFPDGKTEAPIFRETAKLAVSLEMAAAKGSPLRVLFGKPAGQQDIGTLIHTGLKVSAARWLINNPGATGSIQAWFPLRHIDHLPPGSRQILVGHDIQYFFILRSLGLISLADGFRDGPVLPLDSVIFAFRGDRAAVVRLQVQLRRDGSAGAFRPALLWQGSRSEWDARLARIRKQLESHPDTARLIRTYRQPEPVMLQVDQE